MTVHERTRRASPASVRGIRHVRSESAGVSPALEGGASLTLTEAWLIAEVGPTSAETLGLTGEVVGASILDLVAEPDRRTVREQLDATLRRPGPVPSRCFRLLGRAEPEGWVECTMRLRLDDERQRVVLVWLRSLPGATEEAARAREHRSRLRGLTLELALGTGARATPDRGRAAR